MNFTVTYRSNSGARAVELINAASRADVFAQMKARGISPLSVVEGGKSTSAMKSTAQSSRRRPLISGVIAGLLIVIVVIVAWFLLRPAQELPSKPVPAPKTQKPKAEKPKPLPSPKPAETNVMPAVGKPQTNKYNTVKNPWGTPIPADLEYKPHWAYTEEDYARIDPSYKERHERFKIRQANNPWKTTADSQLSVLLFSEMGQPNLLIPFSHQFKDQFLKSLETPIIVKDDDPPELKEQKQHMIETKIWLKQQMDEGNDIVDILNAEYERQSKVRGLRENLLKELRAIEKTAKSVKEVEDYVAAANKMLEEAGGAKVALPLTLTKIRLQREAQKNEVK